jgi:hypothetical protein
MGQGVGALGEFDRLDTRLVEEHPPFEHIHGRGVEPRSEVHEPSPALRDLPLDHGGRGFTGEPGGVEQVIVRQKPDGGGPFEGRQRGLDRRPATSSNASNRGA